MPFIKATPDNAKIHIALIGPTGAGKTFSALEIATGLAGTGGRVAVADSEKGRAKIYASRFSFDHMVLESVNPAAYIAAIREAEEAGYAVLILDSLTHAWTGQDGALALVDTAAKKSAGNKFVAWADVTPLHNRLLEAITSDKLHVICTMRAKMEYALEPGANGRLQPRKIGLGPVQRDGIEYEFDVTAMMDEAHNLVITKTVFSQLDGKVIPSPDAKFGASLLRFLVEPKPGATQNVTVTAPPAAAAPETQPTKPAPAAKKAAQDKPVAKDAVPAPTGTQSATATSPTGTAAGAPAPAAAADKTCAKWQWIQMAKLSEKLGQTEDEKHAFALAAIKAPDGATWADVKPRLTEKQAGAVLDAMRAAIAAGASQKQKAAS